VKWPRHNARRIVGKALTSRRRASTHSPTHSLSQAKRILIITDLAAIAHIIPQHTLTHLRPHTLSSC
jgi:citrate lyase synthetase